MGYLDNNQNFIVNYGDRCRHGEPITSSFVESAVNQVVSKRFVKRQRMAWRPDLAHGLPQVRTAVLNEQPRSCFERWYPALAANSQAHQIAAQSPRFDAVSIQETSPQSRTKSRA